MPDNEVERGRLVLMMRGPDRKRELEEKARIAGDSALRKAVAGIYHVG
jgi:hypothetical protein